MSAALGDASFHRLRAKGGFVVSASWDAQTHRVHTPVALHAEVGGACVLQLPLNHTVSSAIEVVSGKALQVTPVAGKPGRFSFITAASTDVAVHIGGARA